MELTNSMFGMPAPAAQSRKFHRKGGLHALINRANVRGNLDFHSETDIIKRHSLLKLSLH